MRSCYRLHFDWTQFCLVGLSLDTKNLIKIHKSLCSSFFFIRVKSTNFEQIQKKCRKREDLGFVSYNLNLYTQNQSKLEKNIKQSNNKPGSKRLRDRTGPAHYTILTCGFLERKRISKCFISKEGTRVKTLDGSIHESLDDTDNCIYSIPFLTHFTGFILNIQFFVGTCNTRSRLHM